MTKYEKAKAKNKAKKPYVKRRNLNNGTSVVKTH
jgi:hypothetical protein